MTTANDGAHPETGAVQETASVAGAPRSAPATGTAAAGCTAGAGAASPPAGDALPAGGSSLTRADLECGVARERIRGRVACRILEDSELEASRRRLLAARPTKAGGSLWVFAYGSLIWNPLFAHAERRPARIGGYHRTFCLWSVVGRGSAERPGLVLGLDRGGSCRGLAYRLAPDEADDDLRLLWRREMVLGSYVPRWVRADIGGRSVDAITFVVNRSHPHYASSLAPERIVETLREARGMWGTSAQYFRQTLAGLRAHGINDRRLERIARDLAR